MDAEVLASDLNYLGSSGVVLSVEQKASLQCSLVTLRREHKFRRVKFWGVIRGIQRDYFIVHGVGRNELLDRKALYSQDCISWYLLPYAESSLKSKAALLQGRFTGDPSFNYEHNITHRIGEGENASQTTTAVEMKEEDRVAAVVATIDEEVAVVPRGAYIKGPLGDVVTNSSFRGLPEEEAKRLNYYFHFRPPTITPEKASSSITKSIDFLDTIQDDIPKGCWSLQCDQGGASIILRNLTWPGMVVYHVPNTETHGYFYSGDGEKNPNLLFML